MKAHFHHVILPFSSKTLCVVAQKKNDKKVEEFLIFGV